MRPASLFLNQITAALPNDANMDADAQRDVEIWTLRGADGDRGDDSFDTTTMPIKVWLRSMKLISLRTKIATGTSMGLIVGL